MSHRATIDSIHLASWAHSLDRLNPVVVLGALVFMLTSTFAIDSVTGPRVSMLLLYCIVTAAAAWILGRRAGFALAVGSSIAAALVRVTHPSAVDSMRIVALNATLRTISLLLLVAIVIQLRNTMRAIEKVAATDPLTGLANRQRILERLDHELAMAARTGSRLALAFFDLNELKAANDVHGHAAGDRLIMDFAHVAQSKARATDLVGRLGGDEFIMILPNTTAAGASELVRRICREPATPSVSVGIVESSSDCREQSSTLLARADAAMYAAKVDNTTDVVIALGDPVGL